MGKPVVAIVGRPNVGKSTLFNRILGTRTAVVDAAAGVTRDRLYGEAEWAGREFTLVDTGGLESAAGTPLADLVADQVRRAIAEADLILFVVDGRAGLLSEDEEVATVLRRAGKPVILVVNKIDDFSQPPPLAEFCPLGLGDPVPVSAADGLNTGDLLDLVVDRLPSAAGAPEAEEAVRIAVVGRPNVGKSSLVNALLGEERVIVSAAPGTTRDAVDTRFRRGERHYVFTDTAGMRRKARIREPLERYSVQRAARALARSDVALIVLDAAAGVTNQDQRIAGMVAEAAKAAVLVINKWDLVAAEAAPSDYREAVQNALEFIGYAPVLFVSAVTGKGVGRILDAVDAVMAEYRRRIPTPALNQVLHDAFALVPPPARKGKRLKLLYATQVAEGPPTVVLFVNEPDLVSRGYRRYLENQLRRLYGFTGTPIRLAFRRRDGK